VDGNLADLSQTDLNQQTSQRSAKPHRAGVSKSEIARRLQIGRTSVRRINGHEIAAGKPPIVTWGRHDRSQMLGDGGLR
jgi:DNA invertase Pin-like site-specific DNA recombinase